MAARRGFSWTAFFAGAIALLVLALVAGAIIIFGGLYPVAASKPDPAGVGLLLGASMDNGVKHGARDLRSPQLTAADIREGAGHFKGMCQECHGGPGVQPEEFATVMNPRPPDLVEAQADWSREEIFWIAKHGIKMSGMPAFGKIDQDEELWKVAAFVKALPTFSAAEYAAIPNAHEDEHGHGEMASDKDAHSH